MDPKVETLSTVGVAESPSLRSKNSDGIISAYLGTGTLSLRSGTPMVQTLPTNSIEKTL